MLDFMSSILLVIILLLMLIIAYVGLLSPVGLMVAIAKWKEFKKTKDWIKVDAELLSLSVHEEAKYHYKSSAVQFHVEHKMLLAYNLPDGSSCQNKSNVVMNYSTNEFKMKKKVYFQEGEAVKILVDPNNHQRIAFEKIYEHAKMEEGVLKFHLLKNGILTLLLPETLFYLYTHYIQESLIWFFFGMYILIMVNIVLGVVGFNDTKVNISQGH